ncbi:MAG: UPF0175 family protein [Phycisphaeraceae bacterium]
MTVSFEIPPNIEAALQSGGVDVGNAARQAFLIDLFRQGRVTHRQLSEALGLDRHETNAFLKEHQVFEGSVTSSELEADRSTLDRVLGTPDRSREA